MGNFQGGGNRGGGFRSGGRGGFDKNRGGDRDRERPTMHTAICSECGKSCEVPFRPTGEKPVYCRDCFASKRDDGNSRGPCEDFGFDRAPRSFNNDRPSFKPSAPAGAANDDTKRALVEITSKLDRLITVIEKLAEKLPEAKKPVEAPKAAVIAPKAAAPKVEEKKAPTKPAKGASASAGKAKVVKKKK